MTAFCTVADVFMLSINFFGEVIAFENRLKEMSLCLCIAAADRII